MNGTWGRAVQGAARPPVPPAAGPLALHPTCEEEDCFFKRFSACGLRNGGAGACAAPVPRRQGDSPCTHPAMRKNAFPHFFPHETLGTEKKAHGRYENKEKAGRESSLSPPAFSIVFPGCKASGGWCFTPPARGRQCRSQLAKSQCSFCKGVSAWPAVRAPNSQKCNLPLQRGFCV